ncbi:MAG: SDR family oxidoreductase [Synergistaceae bacterium]|nr:SDR family oxidoreductase [Synergistaceae bacterium]
MLFSLSGENAVVIGGAGGIGQAIAQGLAESGAKVLISSRNQASLDKAKKEIKEHCGADVETYSSDAADEAAVEKMTAEIVKKWGQVHILVNAQGFNKKHNAQDFNMDDFSRMLTVNVVSLMNTCKHFGRHMTEKGYGKIINVSSVRGKIATATPGNCGYCATKGAVDMLTRQLASEYGPSGVTVNAVGPTLTETPMMSELIAQRGGDAYRKKVADNHPMRRMAVPEDCVGTAIFLASHASDYVTGNIVYPDGGLTAIG